MKDRAAIERALEKECAKAVKAARPHLLAAWAHAKELGQCRSFSEWLESVFAEAMEDEIGEEMYSSPNGQRRPPGFRSSFW